MVDFQSQAKLILNQVGIKLVLTRQRDEYILMSDEDGANYKVVLNDIQYVVTRAVVSASVRDTIESRLSSKPAAYPYTRLDAVSFAIPTEVNNWKSLNLFMGKT